VTKDGSSAAVVDTDASILHCFLWIFYFWFYFLGEIDFLKLDFEINCSTNLKFIININWKYVNLEVRKKYNVIVIQRILTGHSSRFSTI